MTRFCSGCGAERAGGAAFCARCGQPFPGEGPAGAGAPSAAPPPQAPPAYAAPQPAAYPPSPMAYGQAQAPRQSGARRWFFIILGIVMVGLGLLRIVDGFSGRSSSRSSSSSSGTTLTYDWLVGTWSPGGGASSCATWVRFNDGGRLIDNEGNSGTWALVVYGTPNGDLTMTVQGMRRSGRVTRIANDRIRFGAQEWSRVSC